MPTRQPKKNVDNSKQYELLGVAKDANDADIKKAFRKLAMKHHPDRGGDKDYFQQISQANDVLSDPEKRRLYDMGGEEAVMSGHGGGGGGMDDIMSMFMGGRGGQQQQRKKRTKDHGQEMQVSLEEIFAGKTKKLSVERQRICKDCNGTGGEGAAKCGDCKGRGMVTRIVQLGPGMITQTTQHCDKCQGEGIVIPEGKKCKKCKTQKIVREKETIEVSLDKGVPNNHKQTFAGKADEQPDHEPGDVVITIKEKEHKVFKRKQADLAMTLKITLYEALCGFEKEFSFLDGCKHVITCKPGDIIQPNSIKTCIQMGLPLQNNPALNGNLFVHFEIEFPKSLNEAQVAKVQEVLVAQKPKALPKLNVENTHECIPFQKAHINENKKIRSEAYDEDDDDGMGMGGQRVQCQTQ